MHAADDDMGRGTFGGLNGFGLQGQKNEAVDGIVWPIRIARFWNLRSRRSDVSPMRFVRSALFNPTCQNLSLAFGYRSAGLWRWHLKIGILLKDTFNQYAGSRIVDVDDVISAAG